MIDPDPDPDFDFDPDFDSDLHGLMIGNRCLGGADGNGQPCSWLFCSEEKPISAWPFSTESNP